MVITIKSYEKFINGRHDIKRPWWFKLSNTFLEDPDFYKFSPAEIVAWIYIMCQASRRRSSSINVDFEHAHRASNVQKSVLNSCIDKLLERGIISVSERDPYVIRTQPERQIRLEEKREEEKNTIAHFEKCATEIYSIYPKKVGKKRGWSKLKTILNKDSAFENLKTAISNYTEHCAKNKTEPKFIKQFDTFLGCWEDWLDSTTGTAKDFSNVATDMSDMDWPS